MDVCIEESKGNGKEEVLRILRDDGREQELIKKKLLGKKEREVSKEKKKIKKKG